MATLFKPATRRKSKLRAALDGPAGSGKTFTALRFAFALGLRVAVIDTEHGSASKYQGDSPDGIPWNFDVLELTEFAPTAYTSAIEEAGRSRYDVLVVDSLSHAWSGSGGALELVDKKGGAGGNKFTAWKDVTPMHNRMIDAIIRCPCHVIVTMRTKMEYILETNEKGKQVPVKVGMGPIQRAGMEYEFDIVGDLDWTHTLSVSKSRCSAVADKIVVKPGADFIVPVLAWLEQGVEAAHEAASIIGGLEERPPETDKHATTNGNGESAKPKLSPIELMKQRAAVEQAAKQQHAAATTAGDNGSAPLPSVAGVGDPTGVNDPPSSPPAAAASPSPAASQGNASQVSQEETITNLQLVELCNWGRRAGQSFEAMDAALKPKYGDWQKTLPRAVAVKLMANFERAAKEREADQQSSSQPVVAGDSSSHHVIEKAAGDKSKPTGSQDASCDLVQQAQLKSIMGDLEVKTPGTAKKLTEWFRETFGKNKVAELTWTEAEAFKVKLFAVAAGERLGEPAAASATSASGPVMAKPNGRGKSKSKDAAAADPIPF